MLNRAFIQLTAETGRRLDRNASPNYHLTRTPTTSIEARLKRLYELPLCLSLVFVFAYAAAGLAKESFSLRAWMGLLANTLIPARQSGFVNAGDVIAAAHRMSAALSRLSRHEAA